VKIIIYTNEVAGGWCPDDIDRFLGGSEEAVVLLSEALVRAGYSVDVYHSQKDGNNTERHGVRYQPREKCSVEDPANTIFITFKDKLPWLQGLSCYRNIHWSAEVEKKWPMDKINYFVNISRYHESRNLFVPVDKSCAIPLGVDTLSLDRNKSDKDPNTMLYCSSPDRGLLQLLQNWQVLRLHYPAIELRIAYGFRNFDAMCQDTVLKNTIKHLMRQDQIIALGELPKEQIEEEYWRAEYWCLPLNKPDAELFCLNALKAQYCGCKPVVNLCGALADTVGDYIPFDKFLLNETDTIQHTPAYTAVKWDEIVSYYWQPLFV